MPFCSRASLLCSRAPLAQPCCLGRSHTGGHQAIGFAGDGDRFSRCRKQGWSAGKGQGRPRALTQGLVLGHETVHELTAIPRRGNFCHLPSQRISALCAVRGRRVLGIPGLRLGAGSCHVHIAQTGWSCPVSICLQINLMSPLPSDLGWCEESSVWERKTAQI